MQQIKQNSTN